MGAHLNCIDKSMQSQMSTYNICLHKEVKKKYTGYNLKTTEFLDCALIGVCAVIRSNTVYQPCCCGGSCKCSAFDDNNDTYYSACIKGSLGVRDSQQKLPWDFQNFMPGSLRLPTFKDI